MINLNIGDVLTFTGNAVPEKMRFKYDFSRFEKELQDGKHNYIVTEIGKSNQIFLLTNQSAKKEIFSIQEMIEDMLKFGGYTLTKSQKT